MACGLITAPTGVTLCKLAISIGQVIPKMVD